MKLAAAAAIAVALLVPAVASADDLSSNVSPLSGTLGAGFPQVSASLPFGMISSGPRHRARERRSRPGQLRRLRLPGPDDPGFQPDPLRRCRRANRGRPAVHGDDRPGQLGRPRRRTPPPTATEAKSRSPAITRSLSSATAARASRSRRTQRAGDDALHVPGELLRRTCSSIRQTAIGGTQPGAVRVAGPDELDGWTRSPSGTPSTSTPYSTARLRARERSAEAAYASFDTSTQPHGHDARRDLLRRRGRRARATSHAEIRPGRSFGAIRARRAPHGTAAWKTVRVSGGDAPDFYTNLYRSLLLPSLLDDRDGRYPGFDGAIHRVARRRRTTTRTCPCGTPTARRHRCSS